MTIGRRFMAVVGVSLTFVGMTAGVIGAQAVAHAAPCSDIEVLFGRGRDEPPGVGRVGTAFVDAFTPMVADRSVAVYALDYPAAGVGDYGAGANDMSRELQRAAGDCPATKFVVGGYSLGAAATDVMLGVGLPGFGFDQPLPPEVADRIA